MKIQYTFDPDQQLYVARGFAETVNTSFFASGDSISELENDLKEAIETVFIDEAEKFNNVQESMGSFTKFMYPKPVLEEVKFEAYYD